MASKTLWPEDEFREVLHDLRESAPAEIAIGLRKTYDSLLLLAGNALFDIVRRHAPHQAFDFYFWPGYESIYLRRGAYTRVTLALDPEGERPQCGVGINLVSPRENPLHYSINRSVLWFDRVLISRSETNDFTPGSTHKWLVQFGLRLADGSRLQILDVSTSPQLQSSTSAERVLIARLDSRISLQFGQQLSSILNGTGVIGSRKRWPYSEQAENEENQEHDSLRERLYDIWLAATLNPPDESMSRNWLASIADECVEKGAPDIAAAILTPEPSSPEANQHHYRHWYSLAIDPMVGSRQELGTAMLFTSIALPTACLFECQGTVWRMYSQWRELEEWLLKIPLHVPLAIGLTASEWGSLRSSLMQTCERLGSHNDVGHPFWAHHLPGGGNPWRVPRLVEHVAPWTDALIDTTISSLEMLRLKTANIGRVVKSWPHHKWLGIGEREFEESFCWSPPIRSLASFDSGGGDMTRLFEILKDAVNALEYIECLRPTVDVIEHDYLWFNAPALANCLFIFARGLSENIFSKKQMHESETDPCIKAIVHWKLTERHIGRSLFLEVRVSQTLRYPRRDRPWLLPSPERATKKVAGAYQCLQSIGARLEWRDDYLLIVIGPGSKIHHAGQQRDYVIFGGE